MVRISGERWRLLARQVPIVAHGVGLSLGTDAPLDEAYVREVAHVVRRPSRPDDTASILAFTCVPGRDLGNLLPLPKTPEIAEWVARKGAARAAAASGAIRPREIPYLFDWPDSRMSDGQFMTEVCQSAGAGILLDIENVYVNAHNHGLDARVTIDEIPPSLVRGMHVGGGFTAGELLVDSHDHAVPEAALDLLATRSLGSDPDTIVLERDDNIEVFDELLADLEHIRECVAAPAKIAKRRYDENGRVFTADSSQCPADRAPTGHARIPDRSSCRARSNCLGRAR